MFRFKCCCKQFVFANTLFQYILCFGSSLSMDITIIDLTSFQYILCFGSREEEKDFFADIDEFQYILCFGSRKTTFITIRTIEGVSIHPMFRFKKIRHRITRHY